MVTVRKPPETSTQHPSDIQALLQKHEKFFRDLPSGRPLDRGFEHIIELEKGTQEVITTPYRHPKRYKDEIEKTIKELLKLGYIRPSSSPFASSVVLVKKKDGTLRMSPSGNPQRPAHNTPVTFRPCYRNTKRFFRTFHQADHQTGALNTSSS